MSDILVRGVSPKIHRELRKLAEARNLSLNQAMIHWLHRIVEDENGHKEKDEERAKTFRRIREIREANFREFGLSEDSTKLIREDRDSR